MHSAVHSSPPSLLALGVKRNGETKTVALLAARHLQAAPIAGIELDLAFKK